MKPRILQMTAIIRTLFINNLPETILTLLMVQSHVNRLKEIKLLENI